LATAAIRECRDIRMNATFAEYIPFALVLLVQ
jgi:uncharacterized membrane protein YecN with MAPEG domain